VRQQQILERLKASVLVQEGEQPPYDPRKLCIELENIAENLEKLIVSINRTNAVAKLAGGQTLSEAIAQRDKYIALAKAYTSAAQSASNQQFRGLRSEIKMIPPIPPAELQEKADLFALQARQTDLALQAGNWIQDVIE
jgi:hypothetical protein